MTYLFCAHMRHFLRWGSGTRTHLMAGAEHLPSQVEPQREGRHVTVDHSMRILPAPTGAFPHAEPRPGRVGRLPGGRITRYLIPHRHDRARPPSPSYQGGARLKRLRERSTDYLPKRMIQIRRSKHRRLTSGQECESGKHASARAVFFSKIR